MARGVYEHLGLCLNDLVRYSFTFLQVLKCCSSSEHFLRFLRVSNNTFNQEEACYSSLTQLRRLPAMRSLAQSKPVPADYMTQLCTCVQDGGLQQTEKLKDIGHFFGNIL